MQRALAILFSVALATAVLGAPDAAPRISFEAKEIDFGKIISGEKAERVFRFKNTGTAPLQIRRVKPSCGCTAAVLSKGDIPPGATGEIAVQFDGADRQGFQNVEVHVFSNDPSEKDQGDHVSVLRLRGEVANLLSVMPMSFYFPAFLRGAGGGDADKRITVLATDRPAVSAVAVSSTSAYLKATAAPLDRGGKKGFEVVLGIAPDIPFGKIEEFVTVTTDHPRQRTLRIAVFGAVHGPIVHFPERLQLLGQEGEKDPAIHLMRVAGDPGLPIGRVEAPPMFAVETTEVIPGKRAEIALKLKPDAARGPFAGVVRIFLDDARQPLIEVPITGEVPRKVRADPPAVWLDGPGAEVTLRLTGGRATSVEGDGAAVVGGNVVVKRPAGSTGALAATLRITTDAGEVLDVPVRGR